MQIFGSLKTEMKSINKHETTGEATDVLKLEASVFICFTFLF